MPRLLCIACGIELNANGNGILGLPEYKIDQMCNDCMKIMGWKK